MDTRWNIFNHRKKTGINNRHEEIARYLHYKTVGTRSNLYYFLPHMNMQEKLLIKLGRFFFSPKLSTFYSKINDSIRVRTSGSEAVGAWFESLSFEIFLRFRIVTLPPSIPLIHKIFGYQEFSETQNGSPTKFFGDVRQKVFDRKSWYPPIMHKVFRYPKFSQTQKGSPRFFRYWDKKFWTMSFAYNIEISGGLDVCRKPSKTIF